MRLIDADALKANVPSTSADIFENCRNCRLLDEDQVKEIIDNATTIDAEPVRHGHWIKWDDESTYDCSICGDAFTLYEGTPKSNHYNYCPNCGAKMDEVSEC